ncbi:MAG: hypothetical protein HY692_01730 [Cyanobacteria bacterium NC_groundwater_1444_Ag_S-0.65um_54_12]|nr:hypothetical protein [Cyanobacteria bacterium NC_groundwater_1444_Ag_S-0.65um_54_12]
MRHRFYYGILVGIMASGCQAPAIPYVTIKGNIYGLPAPSAIPITEAKIDILSLDGTLGKGGAGRVNDVTGTSAQFSLQLAAATLPTKPTLFKVSLRNPEPPPRDGPLLVAILVLSRPAGSGPELGTFVADLDATSSVAALGIEYRFSLWPELAASGIDPVSIANYLDRKSTLAFSYAQAYATFIGKGSNQAPAQNQQIAQQASEELPADLAKVPVAN